MTRCGCSARTSALSSSHPPDAGRRWPTCWTWSSPASGRPARSRRLGRRGRCRRVAALAFASVPSRWWRHDALQVDGADVDWWVEADGALHARDDAGLAAALAWSAGQWRRRHLAAELLADPERPGAALGAAAFD